jgi:hypothetical protein
MKRHPSPELHEEDFADQVIVPAKVFGERVHHKQGKNRIVAKVSKKNLPM